MEDLSPDFAEKLTSLLREHGLSLACAESCTGGLIAHLITNIPGSSKGFRGGIVTYSNEAKAKLLTVPTEMLETHGAVSESVASEMAKQVRQLFDADIGISSTGVAGPSGGSVDKPVGLVYLGISTKNITRVEKHNWPYDRIGNKESSAEQALQMVVDLLQPPSSS